MNNTQTTSQDNVYIWGFPEDRSHQDSNNIVFECGSYWRDWEKISTEEIDKDILQVRLVEKDADIYQITWDYNDNEKVVQYKGNIYENKYGKFAQISNTEQNRKILSGDCFSDHPFCVLTNSINNLIIGTCNIDASIMAISNLLGIYKLKETNLIECQNEADDILESMHNWISGNNMTRFGHRIELISYSGIATSMYYEHNNRKAKEFYDIIINTNIDIITIQETNLQFVQCFNDLCRRNKTNYTMIFIGSSQEETAGSLGFIIKTNKIRASKKDINPLTTKYGPNQEYSRVIAAGLNINCFTIYTIHRKIKNSTGCEEIIKTLNELTNKTIIAGDFNQNIIQGLDKFKKLRIFYDRINVKTTRSFYNHDIDHIISNFADINHCLDILPPMYDLTICNLCCKNNKCNNRYCTEIHTQRRHSKNEKSETCCSYGRACRTLNCPKYHGCRCYLL
jgi:hypothetical protein